MSGIRARLELIKDHHVSYPQTSASSSDSVSHSIESAQLGSSEGMTRLSNMAYHNKYSDAAQAAPDITVFFLQASRSIRPVWLLEELQLPYKLEFSDRVQQKAPPEFKQASKNPLGKFPTVWDGDLVLYESGAITQYLCERYDHTDRLLGGSNPYTRSKVQTWCHAAEGTFFLHGLAVIYARWNYPNKEDKDGLEQMEQALNVNVRNDLDWIEAELGRSTGMFLVGNEVTAADIMTHIAIDFMFARKIGTEGGSWPRTQEWLERCKNTESYKRAVEKSGHTLFPATI